MLNDQVFVSNTNNFQTDLFDPRWHWNTAGSNDNEEKIPYSPELQDWSLTTR